MACRSTWLLIVIFALALSGCDAAGRSRAAQTKDSPIEAHIRYSVLPAAIDFVKANILDARSSLAFDSTEIIFVPETNLIVPKFGHLISPDDELNSDRHRAVGTFLIEFFATPGSGVPRSVKMTFDFEPDFKPREQAGTWQPLFEEARAKGWLKTTWNGMEFEAYDRKGKGMELVLRGPWPLPYGLPTRPRAEWTKRTEELRGSYFIRRGVWLVSMLLPGSQAGVNTVVSFESDWLILDDKRAFRVRTFEQGDQCLTEIAPFVPNDMGKLIVGAFDKERLAKFGELGIKAEGDSITWPKDLRSDDITKVMQELYPEPVPFESRPIAVVPDPDRVKDDSKAPDKPGK